VAAKITLKGIKEFQKQLRAMDADLPKELRLVLNDASELVLSYARPRFPTLTGRAVGSLKAASSQREARISLGGRRAPYAPGLDFGGGPNRPQFPPYTPGGRYVYKGLEVNRDEITQRMEQGLYDLARGAGLEMT
jgi:hypothetical protein